MLRPNSSFLWRITSWGLLSSLAVSAAWAQDITRDEALAAAYPGGHIESERVFLTAVQREQAARLSGVREVPGLIARYLVWEGEHQIGRAYVDTHVVRSKKESLLICLNPDGSVKRIEVTAFLEPSEYRASPAWYRQYSERTLDDQLRLNRAIRPVAGATLTAIATNAAVRRVLAVDQLLQDSPRTGGN